MGLKLTASILAVLACQILGHHEENKYGDSGFIMTAFPSEIFTDSEIRHIISVPTSPGMLSSYEGELPGFSFPVSWKFPIACQVDYVRNELYVYDYTSRTIILLENYNSSAIKDDMTETVQHAGVSQEYVRIAIDWVSHNIYWTDPLMNWIAMQPGGAINDPGRYKIVVQDNLVLPRAIAVDPLVGYLFWSDFRDDSRIERSDLLGQDRTAIVIKNVVDAIALVADVSSQRLYWIDGLSVESVNYDGTDRRLVVSSANAYFFDMALFGDVLMTVDVGGMYTNVVSFWNKNNGTKAADTYTNSDELIYGICSYSGSEQPAGQDLCHDAGCKDMCVERNNQAVCTCREGFSLQADMKTCEETTGGWHRAIVGNTGSRIFLLDIRVTSKHGDFAPHWIYSLPANTSEPIRLLELDMSRRRAFFVVGNVLYWVPIDGADTTQRNTILEASFTITGLSYDYKTDLLYYVVASDPPTIWDVQPDTQQSMRVRQTITGDDPRSLVVVPHAGKAYWISGLGELEYIDLTIDNVTEVNYIHVDPPLHEPKYIRHDVKYDMLYALEKDYLIGKNTTLSALDYQGNYTRYTSLYEFEDVETFALYKEYILMVVVSEEHGGHVVRSADMGFDPPIETENGEIVGLEKIDEIRVLDLDALQPTLPNQCNLNGETCDQICLPSHTSDTPSCHCYVGYTQHADGTCHSEPINDNFILVTDLAYNQIFQIPLDNISHASAIPMSSVGRPDGIIYNYKTDEVLFASYTQEDIWSVHLNGTGQRIFGRIGNLYATPDRLALDHSTGNVYYTAHAWEADYRKDSFIGVLNQDGLNAIIVYDAHKPRDIVLDSSAGYMFWTDYGSGGIYRANLNGAYESQMPLPTAENSTWPNGLAIDYAAQRLYWVDGSQNHISSCDYDGNNTVLVRQLDSSYHLMDIELIGTDLYFTSVNHRKILKMAKTGQGDIVEIGLDNMGNLNVLTAYQSAVVPNIPRSTACDVDNGGCSEFCFPMPGGDRACGCDWWEEMLSDDKTCSGSPTCSKYLDHGQVNHDSTCAGAAGQSCSFYCESTHRPKAGIYKVTCTASLTWDVPDPCEEVSCSAYLPHGHVTESDTCDRKYGQSCDFVCAGAYSPNSNVSQVTCTDRMGTDGYLMWDVPEPCVHHPDVEPGDTGASSGNKTAIGVGVGVGVLLLVVIGLAVLLLLMRMGKISSPFGKKDPDNSTTSFENPRYADNNVDIQTAEDGNNFTYTTLQEDRSNASTTYDNIQPKLT